jgi:hypothetical protein
MGELIRLASTLWKKNAFQLAILSIGAMLSPTLLQNYLGFNYVRLDYVFQTIMIGGVYCYLNEYQLTSKRNWKAYFKVFNLLLSFILLAVTLILFQKFFNRIGSDFISKDLYYITAVYKGWLVTSILNVQNIFGLLLILLTLLIILPLVISPAIIAHEQIKITQALSKATLLVFSKFGLVLGSFIIFELLYFAASQLFYNSITKEITQGVILSIEIVFYFSLYYLSAQKELSKSDEIILNKFGER